jgi:transposase InsO family protein
LRFNQPCKPDQNACIECFNRTDREEVPSAHLFDSLDGLRGIAAEWLARYNEIRLHDALGNPLPARRRDQSARERTQKPMPFDRRPAPLAQNPSLTAIVMATTPAMVQ